MSAVLVKDMADGFDNVLVGQSAPAQAQKGLGVELFGSLALVDKEMRAMLDKSGSCQAFDANGDARRVAERIMAHEGFAGNGDDAVKSEFIGRHLGGFSKGKDDQRPGSVGLR